MAQAEKLGMDTGLRADPSAHRRGVPVWVANYVLMDYGSGAVMAVPATTSATGNSRASTNCRSCR
jgi:leucyl-tRNA synthetase